MQKILLKRLLLWSNSPCRYRESMRKVNLNYRHRNWTLVTVAATTPHTPPTLVAKQGGTDIDFNVLSLTQSRIEPGTCRSSGGHSNPRHSANGTVNIVSWRGVVWQMRLPWISFHHSTTVSSNVYRYYLLSTCLHHCVLVLAEILTYIHAQWVLLITNLAVIIVFSLRLLLHSAVSMREQWESRRFSRSPRTSSFCQLLDW